MDNYFEYIQDYLDGTLLPEDRQRFEHELETNVSLRSETDHQRMLRETLVRQLDAAPMIPALQATLKEAGDRHFGGRSTKKTIAIVRWLGPVVAAAILLVVFNFRSWFATDYEALPAMSPSVTRGVVDDRAALQAAEAYNAEDYIRSIDLLEKLIAADTSAARYPYYLGLSYLGKMDYRQALAWLQPVADGQSVFAEDACYFTAVALWRLDRAEEALPYAQRVTETSEYNEKAEKLGQKLTNHKD